MIDPKIALLISASHGVDEAIYADAATHFESAGLPVLQEKREQEVFAWLQYFTPTALMVWLIKPVSSIFPIIDISYRKKHNRKL
jgi:hypothetical protein